MSCNTLTGLKLLGVDTGGTFTDFVYHDRAGVRFHKVLSTPSAPELAIVQGIRDLALDTDGLLIVHGSTVGTNAVLQNKGARTVYIGNHGLADVLTIGRQARRELYRLQPEKPPPPVPSALCLETGGRRDARGKLVEPLTDAQIENLIAQLQHLQPEAVAINLLYSYLDGTDEARIARALPDQLFVSCSHQVLAEYREYERGIATWLNASVGPLVQGYLQRFNSAVQPARVKVMRSSGQTCDTDQAAREAVHLLLSGPAGGLAAARFIGQQTGSMRLLSVDMGGTSTDVAMVDGDITLTSRGRIGPHPVSVPMVDMHTIGAGGGSIARADAGGSLVVGPESAGSDPGPACYGRGGSLPTVTDANLVLGRLPATVRLGGSLALDRARAGAVLDRLADQLGLDSAAAAAEGVIRVVNENMARALRLISVQRGKDTSGFVLLAFGGAGGLHLCALAESLQINRAIVPHLSGVFSALGMLAASPGRQLSRTLALPLAECTDAGLSEASAELEAEGRQSLAAETPRPELIEASATVDLCYRGQSSTLNLPLETTARLAESFHDLHRQRFGHVLRSEIELVNVRVAVNAPAPAIELPVQASAGEPKAEAMVPVYGYTGNVAVYSRAAIAAGHEIPGPAIITDNIATTFVDHPWTAMLDEHANLILSRSRESAE